MPPVDGLIATSMVGWVALPTAFWAAMAIFALTVVLIGSVGTGSARTPNNGSPISLPAASTTAAYRVSDRPGAAAPPTRAGISSGEMLGATGLGPGPSPGAVGVPSVPRRGAP